MWEEVILKNNLGTPKRLVLNNKSFSITSALVTQSQLSILDTVAEFLITDEIRELEVMDLAWHDGMLFVAGPI